MEKIEPKEKKIEIENLYQFLGFLEKEFGKNATEKFFKRILKQRAGADRVVGDDAEAEEERIKRLKKAEVTPITVAKLNQIIDIESKKLETDLRQADLRQADLSHPERLEKRVRKEKEEMLSVMKGKEIVMDGKGNIEVKIQKKPV